MISTLTTTYNLTHAGLGRVTSQLMALIQPALHLALRPDVAGTAPIGVSRIGGTPDLASTQIWPSWNGVPLGFVAQIALTDLQHGTAAVPLPPKGVLQFFFDSQQRADGADPANREAWRVLYVADTTGLQPSTAPSDLPVAPLPLHQISFEHKRTFPDLSSLPSSIQVCPQLAQHPQRRHRHKRHAGEHKPKPVVAKPTGTQCYFRRENCRLSILWDQQP